MIFFAPGGFYRPQTESETLTGTGAVPLDLAGHSYLPDPTFVLSSVTANVFWLGQPRLRGFFTQSGLFLRPKTPNTAKMTDKLLEVLLKFH